MNISVTQQMLEIQRAGFWLCLSILMAICQKYISRAIVLFYGAIVTSKIIEVHHRQSPLVQEGLDIQIQVTVYSAQNKDTMVTYEELIYKIEV